MLEQNSQRKAEKSAKNQKSAVFVKNFEEKFGGKEKMSTFSIPNENNAFETQNSGAIAQLVEQRTENPCVPGSNPGGTTKREVNASLFCFRCYVLFIGDGTLYQCSCNYYAWNAYEYRC